MSGGVPNPRGATLIARCLNYREDLDVACDGELSSFRWGQGEAACSTCGAYCGIAVASWDRAIPAGGAS